MTGKDCAAQFQNLALVLTDQNRFAEAEAEYRRAVETAPGNC